MRTGSVKCATVALPTRRNPIQATFKDFAAHKLSQAPSAKRAATTSPCLVISIFLIQQVLGLSLAMGTVLFLPLDVANNAGSVECNQSWSDVFCGTIDMQAAWHALFYLIFIFAFFLIPYTIFFYGESLFFTKACGFSACLLVAFSKQFPWRAAHGRRVLCCLRRSLKRNCLSK